MSTAASRNRGCSHVGRIAHLLGGVAIVVVLVLSPPPLPRFGPSLATPLTTSTLGQVALLLAWIALLLLAVALLQRALSSERWRSSLAPAWATRLGRKPARRATALFRVDEVPVPRLLLAPRLGRPDDPAVAVEQKDGQAEDEVPAGDRVPRILLLGPIVIEGVRRPRRATTVELLAFLALHSAGASRDELLEAMWPGQDPRRTRARLWQSVSEARRLLGDAFERDGEHYRLDPACVSTDVAELERLVTGAEGASVPAESRPLLDRALELWRGEPLAGSDYAWADGHTRRLAGVLASLAERAGRAQLARGDARGALHAAERGLELDELNESFVRLALEAEAALGQRDAVSRRFDTFTRILDTRLGLEPRRETRRLYRVLLAQAEDE